MNRIFTIIALCLTTAANADWSVTKSELGMTTATLHGQIGINDRNVPEADLYVLNSPGGSVVAGYDIAKKLKNRPVTYIMAGSAASWIALATKAQPQNNTSVLGFHWTAYPDGFTITPRAAAYLVAANAKIVAQIKEHYAPSVAAEILSRMEAIEGKDQSVHMILVRPNNAMITWAPAPAEA